MKMTVPSMVQATNGDSAIKTSMATISSQSVLQPLALQEAKLNQYLIDLPFSMVSPAMYKLREKITKTHCLNLLTPEARPATVRLVTSTIPTDVPTTMATTIILIIIRDSMWLRVFYKNMTTRRITYRRDPYSSKS